jgi:hypothetical protein
MSSTTFVHGFVPTSISNMESPQMLSTFSQFSPQALMPQSVGLPGAGIPQMNPASFAQTGFAQPGVHGGAAPFAGISPFAYDPSHAGVGQYPFGGQATSWLQHPSFAQSQLPQTPFGALSPIAIHPFAANPVAGMNPYLQNQGLQQPLQAYGLSAVPFASQGAALQIVAALAHLAQQISAQSVLTQQISTALYQLVQQLAGQGGQTPAGTGIGAAAQSPYGGFTSQTPTWGANRQTIQ